MNLFFICHFDRPKWRKGAAISKGHGEQVTRAKRVVLSEASGFERSEKSRHRRGPTSRGCVYGHVFSLWENSLRLPRPSRGTKPTPLFELLEKVSGTSKEVYWLMLFMLGAYVLAPWGIPVSSAASPRPMGVAGGLRGQSGWIRSGVGLDLELLVRF